MTRRPPRASSTATYGRAHLLTHLLTASYRRALPRPILPDARTYRDLQARLLTHLLTHLLYLLTYARTYRDLQVRLLTYLRTYLDLLTYSLIYLLTLRPTGSVGRGGERRGRVARAYAVAILRGWTSGVRGDD